MKASSAVHSLFALCALYVSAASLAASTPDLGPHASLRGRRVFPADNPWNRDVSRDPVDPRSERMIAAIGAAMPLVPDFGATFGKPYVVVAGTQPRVPVTFEFPQQSDPGPYPIPPDAPVEEGEDHHVMVVDRDHWKLYELYDASRTPAGWQAWAGAVFDLGSNRMRPKNWTSADGAGLPMFPGLARYDEVHEQKAIRHALRFTVPATRRAFVYPARHGASDTHDPNLPPMGMRVRLKASVDLAGFPPQARIILEALQSYGMLVADHGSPWYLDGAPDPQWQNRDLRTLNRIHGSDFEVVKMGVVEDMP
jgi:hypothetical protein